MQQDLSVGTARLLEGLGSATLAGAGNPLPREEISTVWSLYWCLLDQRAATPWGLLPPASRKRSVRLELLWWNICRSQELVEGCKNWVVQVKRKTGNTSVEFTLSV